ncbi:hypothetical protein [Microbacterium sp. A93]|uniref:hypothetical protein n=1 Tax=Microbacterium sp. A93 TaxID=3450716 RepID=UPI003F42625E
MPRPSRSQRRGPLRRRPPSRFPVLAVALAGLSVMLGAIGFSQVTAEPTEPITFVVDEGLPYGITQESVEAAAEGIGLAHEPFTLHVVGRDLEWDEYSNGETGAADVMLSITDDPEDLDLALPDAHRVAFSGEDYGDHYRDAATIRETFVNNRTLGHGPHAVLGAALTAADLRFDGGVRTPLLWTPLAALPMFIAVLAMYRWIRRRRGEYARYRAFGEAQLRLARAVLELETLNLRVEVAEADQSVRAQLRRDGKRVRDLTVELARTEQELVAELDRTVSPLKARTEEQLSTDLERFSADTLDLQRHTDVLAQAAEVRSGHAGSRSVLDRLALPLLQSIDEVLAHHERYPAEARALEARRAELLSITHEVAAGVAPSVVLLDRWNAAEQAIRATAGKMSRRLASPKTLPKADGRSLDEAIQERSRSRVSAATAGATDSFAALRASLGLGHGRDLGPLQATERVLALIDRRESTDRQPAPPPGADQKSTAVPYGLVAGLLPLLLALTAGWVVSAQVQDSHIQYGRELTGDQPLAGLQVYGDPDSLREPVDPSEPDPQTHAESLSLDLIREQMAKSLEYSEDAALLPAEVFLTVAVLPADQYLSYSPDPEYEHRIAIDYWELMEAQQQLKQDVAARFPEVVDPRTGDVALGQAILPVWRLADGTFAFDNFLTGEFSVGVSSRMGAYYFTGTEPTVHGTGDMADVPLGWWVGYRLGDLGRAMEYNHLTMDNVSPTAVFWAVSVSSWTGLMTLIMLGMAAVEAARRRAGNFAVRRQLAGLQQELNQLALGLDLSRLDMVAVLGLDSPTGGRAEESEQRLYEMGLVTAWREVDALGRLPRREQRGAAWEARVLRVQTLVQTLTSRETSGSRRAEELLHTQRFGA